MNTQTKLLGTALAAVALLAPATMAAPDGNVAQVYDRYAADFDFKDGVGIHDPLFPGNLCTTLLLGFRPGVGAIFHKPAIGFNFNGELVNIGIGDFAGALNINTGVPCPIPGSPPTPLWTQWDGLNIAIPVAYADTEMDFCLQVVSAFDCTPDPADPANLVLAGDCDALTTDGLASPVDGKGKNAALEFLLQSRITDCAATLHSHDYTADITTFDANFAATGFDTIKVSDVVHHGAGNKYLFVCWSWAYVNPGWPVASPALAHDWKLILDVHDPAAPASWLAALLHHIGPSPDGRLIPGESDVGGDNGFGPCVAPSPDHDKKPAPIIG